METQTTNSLASASSAYLRSAMHQPIRWNEWGEEAFETAKRENKPILLDIGAVWCHWCHVMDRESYDNPEVAQVINERFVAIKVDRDERPDVDSRYQAAVQAISGQGGWPLTAFLTPDGKPFFGGTYFPPDDQWGRPGFKRVLLTIADAFRDKRSEVTEQAGMVMNAISQAETFAGRSGRVSPRVLEAVVAAAARMFDATNGGFGTAPKFPHPTVLDLAIDHFARTGDGQIKQVVDVTLTKMAQGGVYDQLAGGFHRYSVDERWVVPHFEKMSYDNSELLKNYVHAYQALGKPLFWHVARDIIRWMDEWLSDRERGGFYGSQDADINLDDDGDHFTWTVDEAKAVLGEDELKAAALHYDINEVGEMHHNPHKNVLFVRAAVEEISTRLGIASDRVQQLLDSAKKKMYEARRQRPIPYVDKTVYVGWNALCISAYLEAARVLQLKDARHFALRSLDRILAEGWNPEKGLRHVIAYSDPQASGRDVSGVLDDYAFTAIACLDAYETTSALSYFNFARRIADAMIARFYDQTSHGFFDSDGGALGALAARRKPFQDSPTPAANSAAVIALLRLYAYTNDKSYHEKAEDTLEVFAGVAEQFGIFAATYGIATLLFTKGHTQVVIVGSGEKADQLYAAAVAMFALNKAVLCYPENELVAPNLPPALADTLPNVPGVKDAKATAIICSGFTCRPAIHDADELTKALREALKS